MIGANYVVSVAIRATSQIPAITAQSVAATNALNASLQRTGVASQGALNRAAAASARLQGFMFLASASVAALGAKFIALGIGGASDLELSLKKIQLATGATDAQMAGMNQRVVQLTQMTGQSATTIAEQALAVVQAGMSFKQLNSHVGQSLILFGDMMQMTRGMDAPEASKMAVQIAHLFAKYDPGSIDEITNQIYKMQQVQPEGLNRVLTQAGYGVPFASVAGVSIKDTLMLLTMMGQVGLLRGKGGTGLANTILQSLGVQNLTGHRQAARDKALEALGLTSHGASQFLNADGTVDVMKILHIVAAAYQTMPRDTLLKDIYNVFGTQGGRFVATMARPEALAQADRTRQRLDLMKGLAGAQYDIIHGTTAKAFQLLATNVSTALSEMYLPFIRKIRPAILSLADAFGRLASFFADHPDVASGAAIGIIAGTGVAFVGAMATAVLWMNNMSRAALALTAAETAASGGALLGIASFFERIGAGGLGMALLNIGIWFESFGPILLRFAGWVGLVIGALELLKNLPDIAARIANWWTSNKAQVMYNIGFAFGEIGAYVISGVETMAKSVGSFVSGLFSNLTFWHAVLADAQNNPQAAALYREAFRNAAGGALTTPALGSPGHYLAKGAVTGWNSIVNPPALNSGGTIMHTGDVHFHVATPKQASDFYHDYLDKQLINSGAFGLSASAPGTLQPVLLGTRGH